MSVDGYIAGPNGEMDWMVWDWDDELKKYVTAITKPIDCIVLGRKLAQGFIPHWAAKPEMDGADKMNSTHKIVFTKTLETSDPEVVGWGNTVLAKGDLAEEITKLKNQNGKDIIVYGGATFVSSLIKAGLIDEYHLFINPSAIGDGIAIFKQLDNRRDLTLIKSKSFPCGIILQHYQPKHN